ncbi:unnamed protein product, partial [Meganyctiphanes norvegica]
QSALLTSYQSINRCDVNLFGSVINTVDPNNLPILLYDSCEKGLIEHVDLMLFNCEHNVDPTMECERPEKYPLLIAGRKGYHKIVESLLKKLTSLEKLNVGLEQTNIWGNTIFHIITKSLTKSSKEEKANQSDYDNYFKCMDVLMDHKKDFKNSLIIEEDYLLILEASEENLYNFVEVLLQQGANPLNNIRNRDKRNPLQLACSNGYHKIVKMLIDHFEQKETNGKEMLKEFLNHKDEWLNTALHIILSGRDREIKENNENIICDPENKKRFKESNLETEDNYFTCMELVLSKIELIDIDAVNMAGNTALHKATKLFNGQRFVKLLIDNGARTDIKNKRGVTAELFHSNQTPEDGMKDNFDKILDAPGQTLNSVDIEERNNLQKALTNGCYVE